VAITKQLVRGTQISH